MPLNTNSSNMKLAGTIFLICVAPSICARSAELSSGSDADRVAHWIISQQYTNPALPGLGGIKASPEPVAYGPDGKPYCSVTPYYANLAVTALLRTRTPQCTRVAELWIGWYFRHLNSQSAPEGVPCDEFYRMDMDGGGETNCVKPGDPLLCHHNDATDSAAATFFSVLWAAHEAGLPSGTLSSPERKRQVEALAGVVLKLQQADGLCWARADYRVKYLEDNCEVFAGLRDLADLEQDVFNNAAQSATYRQAAERVRRGIVNELYDNSAKLYRTAKFEDGKRPLANLDKWYPDTQAQLWPLLFGVASMNDSPTRAVIAAVNGHWDGHGKPDWASEPGRVNEGWLEAGNAYGMLLAGETERVRTFAAAVRPLKFRTNGFAGPFNVEDAGWLLEVLSKLGLQKGGI